MTYSRTSSSPKLRVSSPGTWRRPQFVWPLLNESVGAEVWVKHEN
jgi:hypothetical protein